MNNNTELCSQHIIGQWQVTDLHDVLSRVGVGAGIQVLGELLEITTRMGSGSCARGH